MTASQENLPFSILPARRDHRDLGKETKVRPARCLTNVSLATAWPATRGVWVTKQPKVSCQQGAASWQVRLPEQGPPRPHRPDLRPQGEGRGAVTRPPGEEQPWERAGLCRSCFV